MDSGILRSAVCAVILMLISANEACAVDFELTGAISAEARLFLQSARFADQHGANGSLSLQPEFYWEWDSGRQGFIFTPFARLDQGDSRRSHLDIRELTWFKASANWELRLGIRKLFWGVAESNHLVDIVNQTDLVENIDGEDKLGQPMINFALIRDWGTLDFFALPGFRERTFPGRSGRLRSALRVDSSEARYESAAENHHLDYAIRYSNYVGDYDFGLYHFWGTSREPRFIANLTASGEPVLIPFYDLIHQTGLDVQATKGNWLWKLEALRRSGQGDDFFAAVGGFEYTLVGVIGSVTDLGVLGEYHFDDRHESALTPFNHDVFLGARWALNDAQDTAVLAGLSNDLNGNAGFFNVEASRRLGDRWKIEIEIRMFFDVDRSDLLWSLERDDYLQIELQRYF